MDIMQNKIEEIKGVGPTKAKLLKRLGVSTVEDVLYYFPRSYKDKSEITQIKDIIFENHYTVSVEITGKAQEVRPRKGLLIVKFIASDDTGKINIVWFNNKFIKNMLKAGDRVILYGKVKKVGREYCMESPEFEKISADESLNLLRIAPDYSLTEGLYQKDIRKYIKNAIDLFGGKLQDIFPNEVRKKYGIAELNYCLNNIHFPESYQDLELARSRFKFEELFMLQSGLMQLRIKNNIEEKKGIRFKTAESIKSFTDSLPFRLTNAQKRVMDEVLNDMGSERPMNRLVQGDVGSGKTVIALIALYNCVKNGYQGALMVPTEILAEQHYLSFTNLLKAEGIKVALLTGSLAKKEKSVICEGLAEGSIDIVIGTHSLIEEDVCFKKLGLAVTDEQHRFGVKQRTVITDKGDNPDVLVMTATPIPRTLTLILYGDLDISIIDEMPPGRKKVETYFIDSGKKQRMFNFIKKELDAERQVFVVCPLVEESEKLEANSAVEYKKYLEDEHLKGYRIGLLHGKMKADEKKQIMESFRNKEIQILVSTTVVEVGVNIPNATIMIIENADRFGMAQLHQLRGRVGRGEHKSYCILVSDTQNKIAVERLKYMTATENGFEIADKDLELRGGGEVLGLKQHGLPDLKLADIIRDVEILKRARELVEYIYRNEKLKDLEYKNMAGIINRRFERKIREIALN